MHKKLFPKPVWTEETVTPELAADWLNANTHNRPLSNAHVARLSEQMKTGRWALNGDSIGFDWFGVLMVGQHRLYACVEAQTPFVTFVVRGLDPEAFNTKGTLQKPRSVADILAIAGEKDTRVLGTALQWLTRYRRGNMDGAGAYSITELQESLSLHPGIRGAQHLFLKARWLPRSLFVFLGYAFGTVSPELTQRMAEGLKNGFEPSTPFHLFREKLLNWNQARGAHLDLNLPLIAALAIKAFNAEREGRLVASLRWNIGTETFPKIVGLKLD